MEISKLLTTRGLWVAVGMIGQSLFFMRFLIQWLHSERHGKSIIPVAFWYFSIVGGSITLAYAVHIHDPVFILGSSIGFFVYARNLYFIFRERRLKSAEVT